MQTWTTAGFAVCLALTIYTVAGYPLLLGWLAVRFGRPVRKKFERRTVSVLIPVHNGDRFLAAKLDSVLGLDYSRELLDVLVISDGSTDRTEEIARKYQTQGIRLHCVPRGGKAAALNAGIAESVGEILVLTDVRQTLEPQSLARLVACLADPSVGVVSGDLVVRPGTHRDEMDVGLYWRYERWIRKQLGNLDSTLGATGPLYAIRRELAVPLPHDTLLDDVYLPLAAFFRGYRLVVEEEARAFDYPTTLQAEFGRKVRTLAGNYQILWQYPALLTFRNRMLFHYLSYKLARLLLPYCFLGMFVLSFGLPEPWDVVSVAGQAGFYLLALLDLWIPQDAFLKRLSSAARTVVSLLAAAVFALAIFFVPPQRLWKPTKIQKR